MSHGRCKLTEAHGEYVEAHIVPMALTLPAESGRPFIQAGKGNRPVRRWSSWYDKKLVIQAGENILTRYDTWAIPVLRDNKMVWSGWGERESLGLYHELIADSPFGIRVIESIDGHLLRLFLLSILWRAAASERKEFSDVSLDPEELRTLGQMLISERSAPLTFYPITLTQISTLGIIHNFAPTAHVKAFPRPDGDATHYPIYRFYFDGLIAHFHRPANDPNLLHHMGPMAVGSGKKLVLTTVTFEASFQNELGYNTIYESILKWGAKPHFRV